MPPDTPTARATPMPQQAPIGAQPETAPATGFQTAHTPLPSLRTRLLRHVLAPLALTWLVGTAISVLVANGFVQRAFDRSILDDAYAVAANVRVEGDTIAEARIGLTNMGTTPLRATATEVALVGVPLTEEAVAAACADVAAGTNPPSDLNADADYRRHLATVLTRRAVLAAAGK